MRNYFYFSFIIYIGLLVAEFVMYPLYDYIQSGKMVLTLDLFLKPLKFSLIGGVLLVVVNKIFPTREDKN